MPFYSGVFQIMNYYLHRLLFKTGFFSAFNITLTKNIEGCKFKIPIINKTGYYNLYPHELWMDALLKDIFSNTDGSFADAGMNIGQTLLKAAAYGNKRKYIGFEPNPICFYCCQKIIELNSLDNFEIFPVGLYNTDGIMPLHMDNDYASGASVIEKFRNKKERYTKSVNAVLKRGDDFFLNQRYGKIDILKIDVEGAEPEVVEGLQHTITADKPFIITEILPVYNLQTGNGKYRKQREDALLNILFQLGYRLYRIDEKNVKLIPLSQIEVHGSMSLTNYLFVHEERIDTLNKFKYCTAREIGE